MSDAIWSFHRLRRDQFAAAALAVSSRQKQQEDIPLASKGPDIDEEELSDDDSTHPRELVASSGKLKLQKKFLNRLAEILARQKTPPGRKSVGTSTDADHVSAAILGFKDDVPLVYVAKNAGLDEEDNKFLSTLQAWLRLVSLIGDRRPWEKDAFWLKLIEYNRSRLEFYVSKLAQTRRSDHLMPLQDLQDECKNYVTNRNDSNLTQIIANAYSLRYKSLAHTPLRAVRLIGLLSRLRAAWETLQEFAMHHTLCKDIEVHAIEASPPERIRSTDIRSELEKLQPGLSSNIKMKTDEKPWKHLLLHTHAEIQLLLFYGRRDQKASPTEYVRYMGSSKKTCWLCEQTLTRQAGFSSRGSHGEVSPHWTIQTDAPLELEFVSTLIEGMCAVQSWLIDRISSPPGPHRIAVPPSTPAVTSSGSAATIAKAGHRRSRRRKDQSRDNAWGSHQDEILQVLGEISSQISAIRLPADGEAPLVHTLDLCANLAKSSFLGATSTVPDFRPFWGDALHTEQDHQQYEVKKNENKANDGMYMIFYNTSEVLPLNICAATMLHLNQKTEAMKNRLFWQGDVFIIQFDDKAPGGGEFLSLGTGTDMTQLITLYLRHTWDEQGLERLRESRQQTLGLSERHRRNREVLEARLTPLKLEILSHLPPGLEANLEFLAIQNGDYGAVRDSRIEPCEDDPTMVKIVFSKRIDKLETMGWKGFSAEQL